MVPRRSVGRRARCVRCGHRFIIAVAVGTTAPATALTAALANASTAAPTTAPATEPANAPATAPAPELPKATHTLPAQLRLPLLAVALTLGVFTLLGASAGVYWLLTLTDHTQALADPATDPNTDPTPVDTPPPTDPAPDPATPTAPTPTAPTNTGVPSLPAELAPRLLRPARLAVPLGVQSWTTRAMFGLPQANPPLALVCSQPVANAPLVLEMFDMTTGRRTGRYDLPKLRGDSPRLALSPSGQRLALETAPNRLTVFALPEYYQIVSDFQLPKVPLKQNYVDSLAAFSFAGEDRLLTVNGVGRVEWWALPAMKSLVRTTPTATMQLSRTPLEQRYGMLASPDGERITVPNADTGFIIYHLTNAKVQGQFVNFSADEFGTKFGLAQTGLAYVPDSATLAFLINPRPTPRLLMLAEYDTAQRKLTRQVRVSIPPQMRPPQWLAWAGPDRYLLGDASNFGTRSTALVAANDGRLLARFELPNGEGVQTTQCPAGQLWYVAGTPESDAGFLVAVDLPNEADKSSPTDAPTPRFLLTPWGLLRD